MPAYPPVLELHQQLQGKASDVAVTHPAQLHGINVCLQHLRNSRGRRWAQNSTRFGLWVRGAWHERDPGQHAHEPIRALI